MASITHLSTHCLIDRPTHLVAFRYRHLLVRPLLRLLYRVDPQMHFTAPAGLVWRTLGVGRSTKNPNMCTL